MSLAATLEQTIRDHRMMPIDSAWADEIVFPYYEGLSICNLAHTVTRLLIGPAMASARLGSSPLDARLWEHLEGQIERVVLFLSDGLGWRLLQEMMAEDATVAQIVADLTGTGTLTPITSIAPSTTAAALPSLWTGAGPAATGMVGTKLFLRELGVLADMLYYRPLAGRHRAEVLEEWGIDFDNFLPLETLGEVLGARQIPSYVLLDKALFGNGLSRLMHRGVKHPVRHISYTDLWVALRDLLQKTRGERCFVNIYWGAIDGISHLHGTVSEHVITEIRRQLSDLRDTLRAEGTGDGRTLIMVAADHGHTPVPDYVDVSEHAPLYETLRCGLGGDGRFAHFYLRHDFRAQAIEYLTTHFGDQMAAVLPCETLQAGLFGPEPPYAETAARLGDLSVIMRAGAVISDRPRWSQAPVSRHAGLSDREMLVPLLMCVL